MRVRLETRAKVSILLGFANFLGAFVAPAFVPTSAFAEEAKAIQWDGSPASEDHSRVRPVVGRYGMVVSDDRQASEIGTEFLKKGGNAVDAIVATAFTLAVTRPQFATLGGGGFLLYCKPPKKGLPGDCTFIDYREQAPMATHKDFYLDTIKARKITDAKKQAELSQIGALAPAIPGTTAGLLYALEKYGRLKRAEILKPAIEVAEKGFQVPGHTESLMVESWGDFNAAAKEAFSCGNVDGPCKVGEKLVQKELAGVLKRIAAQGRAGFYEGETAKFLVEGLKRDGGVHTLEDYKAYEPKERKPLYGSWKGSAEFDQVVTAPPPSAGGTAVLQWLYGLNESPLKKFYNEGIGSFAQLQAWIFSMNLAFSDRATFFGDPDFLKGDGAIPSEGLISEANLKKRYAEFSLGKAALGLRPYSKENHNTTHLVAIDRDGGVVSLTTTINANFGSSYVVTGTGVLMNNEMDDFVARPGSANLFGLEGTEANYIAPKKRPLSSMTPTIVRSKDGSHLIAIGAQGGPRITSSVFQALLARIHYGWSLPEAIHRPRIHTHWKPEKIAYENGAVSPENMEKLKSMGYTLEQASTLGRIQALERFSNGRVWGISDPRTEGAAVAEVR